MEMVAEQDDSLMEKYFEAGELTQEQLIAGLKKTILERKVFPVFCCSALLNIGMHSILNAIVDLMPNPRNPVWSWRGEHEGSFARGIES